MTFFCFVFFDTMNGMRQFIAAAIVFWGTRYLFSGKYVKYIIAVLLAYVFHITALFGFLGIVAELFNWKNIEKKQKRFVATVIFMGLASSVFIMQYLIVRTEKYVHYFNNIVVNVGFRLPALILIFILSLFIFDKRKYISLRKDVGQPSYLVSATRFYYLCAVSLGTVGYFFAFMERMAWIYIVFEGVYFGMLAKENNQIRRCLLKIPILLILLYVLINYLFFKNGAMHHPYVFVWNQ